MLSVRSVLHRFDRHAALVAPDFTLAADEHCGLLGPSGSGKTTLLHVLAGILPPSGGSVTINGDDLYRPPRDDRWRARRIGLVPQQLHLLDSLSALDNVGVAQFCLGRSAQAAQAADLLLRLDLDRDRHRLRPAQLSQGQCQRVAIARALVNRPLLLLADEPTSALDDASATRAIEVLLQAARGVGALLVVATHDARIRARFARVIELASPLPLARPQGA
jgi:ABC-type lipoprotein export system ATPase subunit